jgi:chemotaxis-related protein WspB
MALPASRSDTATPQQLFLLFRIGADRYALDAREVAEVVALRALKQIPEAPAWVAGVLAHRGQAVPVIDLAARAGKAAPQRKTSTRLALVHYCRAGAGSTQLLGLVLEQATDTLRCRAGDFRDYGLDQRDAPWLGPVLELPQGLVQRISVQSLLPADVHALLFPAGTPAGSTP